MSRGSALWAYDQDLKEFGIIGAVRGSGAYQGEQFTYRDLRRAVAEAKIDLINQIIHSGIDVNRDENNQLDGWMLARAIDFAVQANNKFELRPNSKHQEIFKQRIAVIKTLMLGGADPRLNVSKPTRYMAIKAFESSARIQPNLMGETPLSIATEHDSEYAIIKMLFTDLGNDLPLNDADNLIDRLVTQNTLSENQVDIIN